MGNKIENLVLALEQLDSIRVLLTEAIKSNADIRYDFRNDGLKKVYSVTSNPEITDNGSKTFIIHIPPFK